MGQKCHVAKWCFNMFAILAFNFRCASFSFAFEGGLWNLIVLIPDHCLSALKEIISQTD